MSLPFVYLLFLFLYFLFPNGHVHGKEMKQKEEKINGKLMSHWLPKDKT